MIALAVDPDLHTTGVALVESDTDGFRVVAIQTVRAGKGLRDEEAVIAMAGELHKALPSLVAWADVFAVEGQRIYQQTRANPMDLIRLAQVAGAAVGLCRSTNVLMPEPAVWKGQLPKDVHHARVRKKCAWDRWEKSNEHERDAVCLAVWRLEEEMRMRKVEEYVANRGVV